MILEEENREQKTNIFGKVFSGFFIAAGSFLRGSQSDPQPAEQIQQAA
jgi:hypothetical protein